MAVRLVVDITHPCDVSFFKASIRRWRELGHEVSLLYLERGVVPRLVHHEYPDLPSYRVGVHASTRLGLYFRTGLWREVELLAALWGRSVDVVIGFPGFQTALVAKLLGVKSLGAYDDAEHRPNLLLAKALCDRLVLPEYLGITGANIVRCRALKEWAYLAPRHFAPNRAVLAEYGLLPKSYLFVREIEPRSLNYAGRKGSPSMVEALYRAGLDREQVVLSLEDKRRRSLFAGWRILDEPVSDIHSLMYYSALVASTGDSMAREGAQLGVPSVYLGDRRMKANDVLLGMKLLRQITEPGQLVGLYRELIELGCEPGYQDRARAQLDEAWEDPGETMNRVLDDLVDSV